MSNEMVELRAAGMGPKEVVQIMQGILLLQDREKIRARLREFAYRSAARP